VGDERDELAAGLIDRLERLDARLRLRLLAALLDDAREQVGDGAQLGDVRGAELPRAFGLDVEHPDRLVVPRQRNAQHRGHEPALVEAADPQEARIGLHVLDDLRLAVGRDVAGHALTERDPRAADLEPVETVGRGQRQVRSVPVEQVEGGDIGMERVARPIDDRLEELVPRARGRRQARHVMDEVELVEFLRRPHEVRPLVAHGLSVRCHRHHLTRVGKVAVAKGCDGVLPGLRKRPPRSAA
jgi:hypothetical protein